MGGMWPPQNATRTGQLGGADSEGNAAAVQCHQRWPRCQGAIASLVASPLLMASPRPGLNKFVALLNFLNITDEALSDHH